MSINAPLVSVGIPSYKTSHLSRAIESVLNQTYKNLEIIIVNDCSPHDVGSIVSRYSDDRIRYYVNERNIGGGFPARSWNVCLGKAAGDYFSMLCDDDAYEPSFIEEMLSLARKYPGCNVFHSSVKVLNAADEVIQTFPQSPEWESCADYIINVSRRKRKQTVSEWMYRRSQMAETGGYADLPMAWGSDYLSVMTLAKDGGIASTDKYLAMFRRTNENITMRRQGLSDTKMRALAMYKQRLMELVNADEELKRLVPMSCIERIKWLEDIAVMTGAGSDELQRIVRQRKNYGIRRSAIAVAYAKRAIKSVINR